MIEVQVNHGLLALGHLLWPIGRVPPPAELDLEDAGVQRLVSAAAAHLWSDRMNYLHSLWFDV